MTAQTAAPDEHHDDLADDLDGPDRRGPKILAGVLVALVAAAAIGVLAALTFSVEVSGKSMEPTLRQGDRLITDFTRGSSQVHRFDVVGAKVDGVGVVVKRVIGMPGDAVSIRDENGAPVVVVRPAGSSTDQVVRNPAWVDRIGGNTKQCCGADGKTAPGPKPVVVPEGSYWVIGDNWGGSDDSRVFGFVPADRIGAKLNFRILPLGDLGRIDHDVTLEPVEGGRRS